MTALDSPPPTPVRAYYSLIQFCPDTARLETVNIGVALFCEKHDFLQTRMSGNNRRIVKVFGRGDQDLQRLRDVKQALRETIESRRDDLGKLEQLQKFASLHVNHLRMTQFMPCRIASTPESEIETLFNELVGLRPQDGLETSSRMTEMLDTVFGLPEVMPYMRRNVEVNVPIYQTRDSVPYAYQNGRLNLIKPIEFPKRQGAVIDKAARNAVEGKSIFENPDDEHGELQLVVVGSFERTKSADIETASRIFEDNRVRLYTTDQLDDLKSDILTNGHPIAS